MTTTEQPPLAQRLGAGISYTAFTLLATTSNLLVIYALHKHRKIFGKYPFYTLAKNIIVASIGELITQIVVAVPLSFAGLPLYGNDATLIVLSSLDTFFFLTLFFTSLFIALNRCFVVFCPKLYALFFTDFRLYVTCAVPWILSGIWVFVTTFIGCPKVFRHDGFYYMYRCTENLTDSADLVMHISKHMSYTVPAMMLIVYALVLWRVRTMVSYQSNDGHILIQSLLICIAFEIETILFAVLPNLEFSLGMFWLSLILNYTLIFTASISSIILAALNPVIRATVLGFFPCLPQPKAESSKSNTNYRVYDISDEYGNEMTLRKQRKQKANVQIYPV
uniref:G_PROTEIN_RECEP_F1_2 domain-containing protein n=1 Tax=Panagrellus redivivus TaxID=6233 RepID=A0A7E4W7Q0_PANRE